MQTGRPLRRLRRSDPSRNSPSKNARGGAWTAQDGPCAGPMEGFGRRIELLQGAPEGQVGQPGSDGEAAFPAGGNITACLRPRVSRC